MAEDILENINSTDAVTIEIDVVESAMTELTTEVDALGNDVPVSTVEESVPFEVSIEEFAGASTSTKIVTNHTSSGPNQHTIGAITGLREELDSIKKPQTVYANRKYHANYFMWQDSIPTNAVGLFVAACDSIDKIRVCKSTDDVFGVTVPQAAFVGGQSDIARDHSYGLVINAGLASVQCESDVVVGDYVVPNDRGQAQKSNGKYGYLVTGLKDVPSDVQCVVISLTPSSILAQDMSNAVQDLTGRMDTAEYNIVSTGNVANSAYAMAQDAKESAEISSEYIEEKVADVLGRMDATEDTVENLNTSVESALTNAELAKTTANNAVSAAESIRSEAVTAANNALSEVSAVRQDLEAEIDQINSDLNTTNLELQATKEDLSATIDDLRLDTEGAMADFKNEVADTYATTTQLAAVKTENADAIAAVKQEASDTYATIESVTSLETETSKAIAGVQQQADTNKASLDAIATWQGETTESIAGVKQTADKNAADISAIATWKSGVEDEVSSIASIKTTADENRAAIEQLVKKDTELSTTIAGVETTANANKASIESITSWQSKVDPTINSVASIKQTADDNAAAIESLTEWQGTTNTSITNIKQQADANGAKIEALVADIDRYSVGEYSQAYGLTLEQAKSILAADSVYVPTVHHAEVYGDTYTQEFAKGYYYTWDGAKWVASTSTAVSFSNEYVVGTEQTPYWVVTDNDVVNNDVTYDLGGLYLWKDGAWVKVASTVDNTLSRAVSSVKQTADSVSAEVTNVKGDVANLTIRVGNNETSLQTVTTWKSTVEEDVSKIAAIEQKTNDNTSSIALVVSEKDGEEVVNTASIVTAINDDGSSISLNADKINFEGFTTFVRPSDIGEGGTTSIDGANIKTGTISAERLDLTGTLSVSAKKDLVNSVEIQYARSSSSADFVAVDGEAGEWSTTAPEWAEGEYMWQKTITTYADGHTEESDLVCIQGAKGSKGDQLYTWIKYADDQYGLNMSDEPDGKSYMGIAYNKDSETESNVAADYTWTLVKGQDTMACYIDSSSGTSFEQATTGTTILTAYLYEGANEIDKDGIFTYTWYARSKDGVETEIGTGKTLTVDIKNVAGQSVYFIADDGNEENTAVLYLARLGIMVLNKGV